MKHQGSGSELVQGKVGEKQGEEGVVPTAYGHIVHDWQSKE